MNFNRTVLGILILWIMFLVGLAALPEGNVQSSQADVLVRSGTGFGSFVRQHRPELTVLEQTGSDLPRYVPVSEQWVEVTEPFAAELQAAGLSQEFRPYYLSTTVIVTDPSRVGPISSFQELGMVREPVYLERNGDLGQHLISMTVAQRKELGTRSLPTDLDSGLTYLRQLFLADRLVLGQDGSDIAEIFQKAPIAVLTDDQAAWLIGQGQRLEVAVPTDGAITIRRGLLSDRGFDDEIPVTHPHLDLAGLRTLTGGANANVYPADYSGAQQVEDFTKYAKLSADAEFQFGMAVLGERDYSPPQGRGKPLQYVLLSAVVILWGLSFAWRTIPGTSLRNLMLLQSAVLISWIAIQLSKTTTFGDAARILAYAYYVPLLFTALTILLTGVKLSGYREEFSRRVIVLVGTGTILLSLLVLTNDLHSLVLRFPGTQLHSGKFEYGIGYWLIFGWIVAGFFWGWRLLLTQPGLRVTWQHLLVPWTVGGVLLLFSAGHVWNLPILGGIDVTFFWCLLVMMLWEVALRTGLTPHNRGYLQLLRETTVPVFIRDKANNLVVQSQGALDRPQVSPGALLAEAQMAELAKVSPAAPTWQQLPDQREYRSAPVTGGTVTWEVDTRVITALVRELQEVHERQLIVAARLDEQLAGGKVVAQHAIRLDLVTRLDGAISMELERLEYLARALPALTDPHERQVHLRTLKITIGFCKRAGMLLLAADKDGGVAGEQLALCLSETCHDFSYRQALASIATGEMTRIPIGVAVQLFAVFHLLLVNLLGEDDVTVVAWLHQHGRAPAVNLLMEHPAGQAPLRAALTRVQQEMAENSTLQVRICSEDETLRVVFSPPEAP